MCEVNDLAASSTTKRLSWSSTDTSTPCTPHSGRSTVQRASLSRVYPMSSSPETDETGDSLMSLTDINEDIRNY